MDEVHLESADAGHDQLRMRVDVAGRRFHADQLRRLTGMEVGDGQARILLDDLRRFRQTLTIVDDEGRTHLVDERTGAIHWLDVRFGPASRRAHQAVGYVGSPVQAFCDLLEVRWLLSEQQGTDLGDEPALEALSARAVPVDSAAKLGFVDQANHREDRDRVVDRRQGNAASHG